MRTEQLLRDTIDDLAGSARPSEFAAHRVLRGVHDRRRLPVRRLAVVLVAATVVVLAALLLPNLVRGQQAVPADTRSDGNWNQVLRVVPPAGWEVASEIVAPRVETTVLQPRGADDTGGCTVQVFGPGSDDPNAGQGSAVSVNGRPGTWRVATEPPRLGHLTWPYRDGAWADVSCGDRALALTIAESVEPGPFTVRLPFEIPRAPQGHRVLGVIVTMPADDPPIRAGVLFESDPQGPLLGVSLVERGPMGPTEPVTVAGRPAVVDAAGHQVCLSTGRAYTCVTLGRTEGELTADQRALLLDTAAGLRLASDVDDPSTWFLADEAVPR